jgi:replicative DNA helicase
MADYPNTKTLRSQLRAYLETKGIDPAKTFRCLNPGHEDAHPSMSFYGKKHFVRCFSCGATYSIFDLIGIDYGLTDFNAQKTKAAELFPTGLVSGHPTPTPARADNSDPQGAANPMLRIENFLTMAAQKPEPEPPEIDQTANYGKWHTPDAVKYWAARGITPETVDRFNLGFDPARNALVIPCTSAFYVCRRTQEDGGPRYLNQAGVKVQLFNQAALDQTKKPVWVTEGAIDALSLLQSGAQAVALNSAVNVNHLLEAIRTRSKLPTLILCLDDDEAGQKFTDKLSAELRAQNAAFFATKIPKPYKDPNQMLQSDVGAFLGFIREIDTQTPDKVREEVEFQQEEREKQREEIDQTSFFHHLTAYVRKQIPKVVIPTGFTNLDRVLNGGLHEGLGILGAMSSLGKTTFALQIANQAAASGQPVVFFSLEMSIDELLPKTISLLSGKKLTQDDVQDIAADRVGLDDPRLSCYPPACDLLFNYGKNLHVIEEARTVPAMSAEVFKVKAITGKAPLVIVDYLQAIQPDPSDTLKEKRHNLDFNLTELKRLSKTQHVPVLVISSLNRDSYGQDITQAAFKESGGIEYSSDLLLGLQFSSADPNVKNGAYDHDKELAAEPRKVQIKVMKNRSGRPGRRVNFLYEAAFNVFEEVGSE